MALTALDFDGALYGLLALVGSEVTVTLEGDDGEAVFVAWGILTGGIELTDSDPDEQREQSSSRSNPATAL